MSNTDKSVRERLAMTLEEVRDRLQECFKWSAFALPDRSECGQMADAIDARLSRAAEPVSAFFDKHALGTKLAPSCFGCGAAWTAWDGCTRHLELPNVYLCPQCAARCKDTHPPEPARDAKPVAFRWMMPAHFGHGTVWTQWFDAKGQQQPPTDCRVEYAFLRPPEWVAFADLAAQLESLLPGLEFSRQTHIEWRDCEPSIRDLNPDIGDAIFHNECVAEYDQRICVIRNAIEALRSAPRLTDQARDAKDAKP